MSAQTELMSIDAPDATEALRLVEPPRRKRGRPVGSKDSRPRGSRAVPAHATAPIVPTPPRPPTVGAPAAPPAPRSDVELPAPELLDGVQVHSPVSSIDGAPRWSHPLFATDQKTAEQMRAYDQADHLWGAPIEITVRRRIAGGQTYEAVPETFPCDELDAQTITRRWGGGTYWIQAWALRTVGERIVRQCTRAAFHTFGGRPKPIEAARDELEELEELEDDDDDDDDERPARTPAPPAAYAAPLNLEMERLRMQLEMESQKARMQLDMERERARIQREEDAARRKAEREEDDARRRAEREDADQRRKIEREEAAASHDRAMAREREYHRAALDIERQRAAVVAAPAAAGGDPLMRSISEQVLPRLVDQVVGNLIGPGAQTKEVHPLLKTFVEKSMEAFGGMAIAAVQNSGKKLPDAIAGMLEDETDDEGEEDESADETTAPTEPAPSGASSTPATHPTPPAAAG